MSGPLLLPPKIWFFPEPLFESFIFANEASQVSVPCSDLEGREPKASRLKIALSHDEDALSGFGVVPK